MKEHWVALLILAGMLCATVIIVSIVFALRDSSIKSTRYCTELARQEQLAAVALGKCR